MARYLNPNIISNAFERLSSRNLAGKTHQERTSAILIFLAIDAACHKFNATILDLNPESLTGKNHRKYVELEFTKLVLIYHFLDGLEYFRTSGNSKQVLEFGRIDTPPKSPEHRISSNFLTVPLKKASNQMEASYYPNRPKNYPLLKMGTISTGLKWGVGYFENWESNLPFLFMDIKSPTPFLDLAIFVCRDKSFSDQSCDLVPALIEQLKIQFTKKLVDYWAAKIKKERTLYRVLGEPFQKDYQSFTDIFKSPPRPAKTYNQMNKPELIARIHELEALLILQPTVN